MSSSGGSKSTTVQKADPWEGVQPYLEDMYGQASTQFQSGGPEYYPGETYIPPNEVTTGAMSGLLGYAGNQGDFLGGMQSANQQMLNAPDVSSNPYVGAMADTVQNRLTQNLNENILPGLGRGAVAAGQYGGSRQGIMEGQAIEGTQEAIGDATASIYGDAYAKGLEQQRAGLALGPTTLQSGTFPFQTQAGVGDWITAEQNKALGADMSRWNYEQAQPYQNLDWYNSVLSGVPWGSTSSTSGGGGGSTFGNIAGGALTGYGLASSLGSGGLFGPAVAAGGANPYMWPMIIGGGLLGAL